MKAIGVGCFWFALKGGQPGKGKFDPKTHLQNIRNALESVDNVSKVTILAPQEIPWMGGPSSEDESQNYFPMFRLVQISFDIFMPKRVMEKYSLGFRVPNSEHYHVEIAYARRLPVTYISYDINAPTSELPTHKPSSTISCIREYLTEKLRGHPVVEFQFLGPSPFHADVFVDAAHEGSDGLLKDLSDSNRGYRTLCFSVPTRDEQPLMPSFINLYNESFGTFYRTVRYRNRALRLKSKITDKVQSIFSHTKISRWERIRRWVNQGAVIDEILEAILKDRMNRLALNQQLDEAKDKGDFRDDGIISKFIYAEASDISPAPVDDVKEILKMLEDRRQSFIRNGTTVLSGLVGGILGATLTFLFTSYGGPSARITFATTAVRGSDDISYQMSELVSANFDGG